jgi:hypothetical protein
MQSWGLNYEMQAAFLFWQQYITEMIECQDYD